jgi:hypothetical protein
MFWLKPRLGDAHKVKTDNIKDRVEFINSLGRTGSIKVTKTKASIITMAIRGLEDNISKHSKLLTRLEPPRNAPLLF